MMIDEEFRSRFWESEPLRPDDERDDYQRDKARIIHSAAFRRLQAKTQVMGVKEGRPTMSIHTNLQQC
jgi:dGTPase